MRNILYALLLLFCVSEVMAQQRSIKGRVTDSEGIELPGVAVMVRGTGKGTITDIDGIYMIKLPEDATTLEFSYVGMRPQQIKVGEQKVINVTMIDETKDLDEVVVIGYGAVKKKELTGAVTQVKSEDLNRIISADLGGALQGMVSGVSVTASSGAPGAGNEILIRGISSVNGSNTPLYVVDGIPQEGDPRLSTNEIETIDVLKDAASCAIYGTRGAAGVILITTKKGQKGDLKVSVNANYGIQHITSQNYLMDAYEQTYFNLISNRNIVGTTDDKVHLDLYRSAEYFQNNTSLVDEVFVDNAPTQNYSVNMSGGNNTSTYNFTVGYFDKKGVIINSDYSRINARGAFNFKSGKWTIGGSVAMSAEDTEYSPYNIMVQTIKYYPTQSPLDPDDDIFVTVGGEEQNRANWVIKMFSNEDAQEMMSANASMNINYEIIKGLSISSRLGLNGSYGYRSQFSPYQKIIDVDGKEISKPEDSYIKMQSINRRSMVGDLGLQYKVSAKDHNVTLFAALTGEKYTFNGFRAEKFGVKDNDIKVLNSGSINATAKNDNNYINTLVGTIGRVQYDWKGRYLLNASVRCDGSSKFHKDNRWGVFPSVSAAWNISEEPFFKQAAEVVNNFKLRASYGTTGNQSFGPYTYSASINPSYDYTFGTDASSYPGLGYTQTAYSNSEVKWETSKQLNFGVDIAFLSNKLTLAAEYYKTDKSDMLFPVDLPGSTGSPTSVVLNVGNMTNSGVELSAQYRDNIGKVWYNVNATFSTNQNEITRINGQGGFMYTNDWGLIPESKNTSRCTVLAEGYEAGAFFLYPTDGVIKTQEELDEYRKIVPTAKMGDLRYVDSTPDGKISDDDRRYAGSGLPKYEIGLNYQVMYKGFDLYMNWYAALGHEIMNGSRAVAYGYGRHKDLVASWSERNQDSPIPAYRGDVKGHPNYAAHTDFWLEDGSFLRLRNVTLGYTLPKAIMQKAKIDKLRFYVSAQNLFTITKYNGYDPEIGGGVSSRGLDKGNYPISALFTLGLNVSF